MKPGTPVEIFQRGKRLAEATVVSLTDDGDTQIANVEDYLRLQITHSTHERLPIGVIVLRRPAWGGSWARRRKGRPGLLDLTVQERR